MCISRAPSYLKGHCWVAIWQFALLLVDAFLCMKRFPRCLLYKQSVSAVERSNPHYNKSDPCVLGTAVRMLFELTRSRSFAKHLALFIDSQKDKVFHVIRFKGRLTSLRTHGTSISKIQFFYFLYLQKDLRASPEKPLLGR